MNIENEVWGRNQELLKIMEHSTGESDRGLALILASHLEYCLRRLIESFLIDSNEVVQLFDGPYAPFGTLSGKTKAAYVMGLITKEEVKAFDAIRSVRNCFAHMADASFDHPKISTLCIKPPIHDDRLNNRDAFLHMAQNSILQILYRDIKNEQSWKRNELTSAGQDKG